MRTVEEIFKSYGVLDADGRHINGTDKETNHHYGLAYEFILTRSVPMSDGQRGMESIRSDVKLMMEVGIADGSSLLAWRDIFPNATCVGLDIHHADRARGDRIEFYTGDQRSQRDCELAANGPNPGRQFDFICEDATHYISDSLMTLLYLWPFVRPGGIYVIEEFANIGGLRRNVKELWPFAKIVNTVGPFDGIEPLVVLRKPL